MSASANPIESRLERIEAEIAALKDREAIRDVIHRYCRSADRCDLEGFKACYWPDGFDDHGFFGGNAWEFCDYVIPLLKKIDKSIHAITNTVIDLQGNRAFCESQWSVVHRLRDGERFLDYWHQGRYLDIFEKRGTEWRILVRAIASDMDRLVKTRDMRAIMATGTGDGAAPSRPVENTSLAGARAPHDPVYLGFEIGKAVKTRPGVADFWGPLVTMADLL